MIFTKRKKLEEENKYLKKSLAFYKTAYQDEMNRRNVDHDDVWDIVKERSKMIKEMEDETSALSIEILGFDINEKYR